MQGAAVTFFLNMVGVVVLVIALAVAVALGLLWRWRGGSVRAVARDDVRLTPDDLGISLGSRATLVQFSSAFCAPCRATRRVLADVATTVEGVAHVEIDAESHLDLVRRLKVLRTPTVFVLDGGGHLVKRASGQPRKADVIAALGDAVR